MSHAHISKFESYFQNHCRHCTMSGQSADNRWTQSVTVTTELAGIERELSVSGQQCAKRRQVQHCIPIMTWILVAGSPVHDNPWCWFADILTVNTSSNDMETDSGQIVVAYSLPPCIKQDTLLLKCTICFGSVVRVIWHILVKIAHAIWFLLASVWSVLVVLFLFFGTA